MPQALTLSGTSEYTDTINGLEGNDTIKGFLGIDYL
jgi:hypothetical protein